MKAPREKILREDSETFQIGCCLYRSNPADPRVAGGMAVCSLVA